ncbi:VOC family protein [Gorillibacterium sp. sgz500922]|uniref:VOC family protein n=1 Tax=Gorillibacterium sp. sgz500922 TaxID=3446694 RepID=UPI003F67D200
MSMQATPFIQLDGKAAEAIRYYEKTLGAKAVFAQTFGEAPDGSGERLPEEARSRVAHSVLKLDGADLFVADAAPGQPAETGGLVQVCLTVPDAEAAKRLFDALAEEGRVLLPLQPVHFSPAYGMVTDPFGVTFQVFTRR